MVSFRVTEWYGTFFVLDFILGSVCLCRFLLRKAVDAVFGSLGVGGGYVSQLTLIVLAAYLLVLPLWELVVPDEYPMSNRYIPQEGIVFVRGFLSDFGSFLDRRVGFDSKNKERLSRGAPRTVPRHLSKMSRMSWRMRRITPCPTRFGAGESWSSRALERTTCAPGSQTRPTCEGPRETRS